MPSVSLVCEGFQRQAAATARGLGFDGLPLAVLRGHVDGQTRTDMVASLLAHTIDEVIAGLTVPIEIGTETGIEPAALDTVAEGTIDEIHTWFAARGWSDGLPIVPPTRERVDAFIAHTGHDPWRIVGTARPSGRDITVWSVAVNGVMAGCRPDDLPILLSLAEVFAGTGYGVEHSGNTTGADALVVLSGAIVDELGFNHGQGALREGTRANTAVGRWVRLFLRNVCGFTPDEHDKATFGNSTKVVLAEDMQALHALGWAPLAADLGISETRAPDGDGHPDAVAVARINSTVIIGSIVGATPAEILPYLADGLVRVTGWDLTHVYGLGQGHYRPLLVLSPLVAQVFGRAGWTKDDLRDALFREARLPAWKFEKLIGEWSNLTAGRRTLVELAAEGRVPPVFAESADPERLVPIVTAPDRFLIAVTGDPDRMNALAMSNDGPHGHWTAARIDRSPSTDLVCNIFDPGSCGPGASGGSAQ